MRGYKAGESPLGSVTVGGEAIGPVTVGGGIGSVTVEVGL